VVQAGRQGVGDQDAVDGRVPDMEHYQGVVTCHRGWAGSGDRARWVAAVIDDQAGLGQSGPGRWMGTTGPGMCCGCRGWSDAERASESIGVGLVDVRGASPWVPRMRTVLRSSCRIRARECLSG